MTLVAAFRSAEGGILLCADREENDAWSSAKRSVDKIYPIHLLPCHLYLAGSGPTPAIIKANELIHNSLSEAFAKGADVLCEFKTLIEACLQCVHTQFPDDLTDMPMNLIVIVQARTPNTVPLLYYTDRSIMFPENYYCAYGSGKVISDYFSDRLYEYPKLDKPNLMAVAVFIFREAHKSRSGVGEDVDMRFLYSGTLSRQEIGPESVKEIQAGIPSLSETFWEYWKLNAKLPSWTAK
jgi:20S proteasome alpha/beta subunit